MKFIEANPNQQVPSFKSNKGFEDFQRNTKESAKAKEEARQKGKLIKSDRGDAPKYLPKRDNLNFYNEQQLALTIPGYISFILKS